ncbi:SixA phosphatase family protein [Marinoscillum sp.]|uniref:SixA phosphatase family protein n=1 Tax=Marinoscillum sp. TaxID=2024838 RepID=UPI003BAC5FFF
MVKKLFLLRHGHAASGYNMKDMERPLTEVGIEGVTLLSDKLNSINFQVDESLISPSRRTRQTADLLLKKVDLGSVEYVDGIYEASTQNLFDILCTVKPSRQSLLMIGHNPGFSYLVEYLIDRRFAGMSPGDMVQIHFDVEGWNEITKGSGTIKPLFE